MPNILPIRLRPVSGEHFSAYLLRLAVANGRSSVSEILSTIGIRGFKSTPHNRKENIDQISESTLIPSSQIWPIPPERSIELSIPKRDSNRVYTSIEVDGPRICPTCISEKKIIPSYSGMLPFTYCLEHMQPLISSCPGCNRKLEWEDEILDLKCKGCGHSIVVDSYSEVRELPGYLEKIISLQDDRETANFINDLLLSAQRIISPHSMSFTKLERPPQSDINWTSTLERAFRLLTVPQEIYSWANSCAVHRRACKNLGTYAIYAPIHTLIEKLSGDWPIRRLLLDTHLSPYNLATGCNIPSCHPEPSSDSSKYYTNHFSLSNMLGCKPSEILALLEVGAAKCIHGKKSSRDAIFDASAVSSSLNACDSPSDGDALEIDRALMVASIHGAHAGHILCGAIAGKINVITHPERKNYLDRAKIYRKAYFDFMADHLASLKNDQLPTATVVKITRLTKDEIRQACILGIIRPFPWKGPDFFLGEEIFGLLEKHILIRRWARLNEVPIFALQARLSAENFPSVIDGCIYERTPELEHWLNQYATS